MAKTEHALSGSEFSMMEVTDISADVDYFFVCGYAGSGKSTYSRVLATMLNANFVEASDIVKMLSNETTREGLTKTGDLAPQIAEKLKNLPTPIVISGVRQAEILAQFEGTRHSIMWIEVPEQIRQERVDRRRDEKDTVQIAVADELDDDLGLRGVLQYITMKH